MKTEQLNRANEIQGRLTKLAAAKRMWGELEWHINMELGKWLGVEDALAPETPAPIAAFRRACLDQIATEEAALNAEMEAL